MEKDHFYREAARSRSPEPGGERGHLPEPSADETAWLARVLAIVRERRGVDFGGYRPATLVRRLRNRMVAADARTPADYLERLRRDPGEVDALVEKLTIKVSRFFRDPPTFEALRQALQARRAQRPGSRLHVWSVGSGQGEEPYSLGILLDELGQNADGVDIVGTDIDAAALEHAALGCYPASSLDGLDPALRARYFHERDGSGGTVLRVRPELRGRVDLRWHDVTGSVSSPQGRRFDLVCCRNVLIYLKVQVQARVEALLAASLLPGGLLCLGEAEWLLPAVATGFDVVDRKARLFRLRLGAADGTSA